VAYLVNITSRPERDLAHLYGEIKPSKPMPRDPREETAEAPVVWAQAVPLPRDISRRGETEAGRRAPHPPRRKAEAQDARSCINCAAVETSSAIRENAS
jgi:hypothetical protein